MREVPGSAPADPDAPTPSERGISPIAGSPGRARLARIITFGALLAGCAAFALASWAPRPARPPRAPDQPARQVVAFEPAPARPTLADPGPDAPRLGDETYVPAISDGLDASPQTRAQRPDGAAPRSPLMVFAGGRDRAPPDLVTDPVPPAATRAPSELDVLRQGGGVTRMRARALGDRNFLLLAGTSIPCVLQTALDSSTPGYVTGVIPTDVWSDNGAVVLLEKGTRVLGEYRGGLRQGQRRLFVVWTRAVTPAGVVIELASPAADALGRAGVGGSVDTRFWDRFSGAVLLSVVDDVAVAVAGSGSDRETTRLPSDAAAIAAQSSVGIGPVLRRPQGAEVTILAAQDFDFSGVYSLRSRTP